MENETVNQEVQDIQPEPVVAQEAPAVAEPQESSAERNFRQLREAKERAERERDEAIRLAQEAQKKSEPAVKPEEESYDIDINDDDFVEGKHLGKVAKKIKKLEKEIQSYQRASSEVAAETKLRAEYGDFDKVVTKENIDNLIKDYPEIGSTIRSNTDLYTQAKSAYMLIKQFGLYKEDKYGKEREIAQNNINKPRPLASVSPQEGGQGPLSKANAFAEGLTDELKSQLLAEMREARKAN